MYNNIPRYNTLVLPFDYYCNMICTATSKTVPLFNRFQLLKLKQMTHFQILGFMYKFTHGLLSSGFKDYFCTQSDIHTYNTRTASHSALSISFARTNSKKKSLKVIGSYLWNDLPLNIRQSPFLASFKYRLKHYLLQNINPCHAPCTLHLCRCI